MMWCGVCHAGCGRAVGGAMGVRVVHIDNDGMWAWVEGGGTRDLHSRLTVLALPYWLPGA
jgi:hypothetical protein